MSLKHKEPKYSEAPEVDAVGRVLIRESFSFLIRYAVRVEFIFIEKTPKTKGKERWGCCRLITSLNAFLANGEQDGESFFCIEIARPIWQELDAKAREALVFHELCHAWAEEEYDEESDETEIVKSTLPHDIEEFTAVIDRYGYQWRGDAERFAESIIKAHAQLSLEGVL